MKIYLAAPLFNPREIAWNAEVTELLEKNGHEVFLPQRDGGKSAELMKAAKTEAEMEAARKTIFTKDYEAVVDSDAVVFITDGAVLDVGACAEVGIAGASGVKVIALHEDVRSFIQGRMNLFVENLIDDWAYSLEELCEVLNKLDI